MTGLGLRMGEPSMTACGRNFIGGEVTRNKRFPQWGAASIEGAEAVAVSASPEFWRDIPGYEGSYQVSSMGRVRSLPRVVPVYDSVRRISYARPCPGVILRQAVCDKAGHVSVHLGKYCRGIPVHQLVMLAFHGLPPPGTEAMHLNGNPKDNRPENLRYGTHSENMTDMYRLGKGHLKLTPEEVRQIRFGLASGWSVKELAAAYGVSETCIRRIRKRRRYAWVA